MITQQIRTNAMVSYFFLGWTFLLGKNNPNFADPFIQAHAKNATKIQLAFLGIFVAYSYFIASYFKEVPLRPLPFSLDRVVTAGLFLWGIAAIIIGAMAAMKWMDAKRGSWAFPTSVKQVTETGSEAEKVTNVLAFIPFIGWIAAVNHPTPAAEIGIRVSGNFAVLLVLSYALGHGEGIFTFMTLLYSVFFVYIAIQTFAKGTISVPGWLAKLPTHQEWHIGIRATCAYGYKIVAGLFSKIPETDFKKEYLVMEDREIAEYQLRKEYYSEEQKTAIGYLSYVPMLPILLLPLRWKSPRGKYSACITQWVVLSIALIALWSLKTFEDGLQTLVIPFYFLGIAHVKTTPYYRLPLVSDLLELFSSAKSMAGEKAGEIQELRAKETSVSFKV